MKRIGWLLAIALVAMSTGNTQAQEGKKKLLLITESKGFVHPVVNRGKQPLCLVERTFLKLAEQAKFFEVTTSQNSREAITAENLKNYDAVWFYTTGELPLSDTQKADLLSFVKNGKGFGGCHSATDTFYKWSEYGELIGGYFAGHPWNAGSKVRIMVEDRNHPSTKHLDEKFDISDEIYQFKEPFSRDKVKVLMKLDMSVVKNIGRHKDGDYAIAWVRDYGKGRVFYTALGHQSEVWEDTRYHQHVLGGLRYMFGMEGGKK